MTEPASVVAARQLAEEARDRRGGIECATSAAHGRREQPSLRTRRVRTALLAVAAAMTAGCGAGEDTVCSLAYYPPGLRVVLDEGWPPGAAGQVEIECTGCDPFSVDAAGTQMADLGLDGVAEFGLPVHAAEVTVRVLEADVVHTEVTVEPDYRPLDADSACPGPSEAEVVVPAP